jgi:hypothetical protein
MCVYKLWVGPNKSLLSETGLTLRRVPASLQLRQAKLLFPSVHLLGVNNDEQVKQYISSGV